MAKQAINILKAWFKRLDKPAQQQFWDWMDSYYHKDEKIPMAAIDMLAEALLNKANKNHLHEIEDVNGLIEALANAGGGAIEHDIIATVSGLGINIGDTVASGSSLDDVVTQLIAPM